MIRSILTVAALAPLTAVLAGTGAAMSAALTGELGPGFTIELKAGSKDVKTLKAGTYTIKVQDMGTIHDFHLFGPGVNKKTSISGTGTQTWTIKLKKGKYTYQCDIHATVGMKGTFRVT